MQKKSFKRGDLVKRTMPTLDGSTKIGSLAIIIDPPHSGYISVFVFDDKSTKQWFIEYAEKIF